MTRPDRSFITIRDEYGEGPLWLATGMSSTEALRLSEPLAARLEAWQATAAALANDEDSMRLASREGAELAQLLADEMGEGVSVYFETRVFSSHHAPENDSARHALDEYVRARLALDGRHRHAIAKPPKHTD